MTDREAESPAPLFCARCRRTGEKGEHVCYECGETLRRSGYCAVCEGWALAGPGQLCPKHEVELGEGRPGAPFEASDSRLVTVATYGIPSEAQGPRLRLEAEGIPAFLQGHRMGDIYQVATGGVTLQVPEELVDDARVLLSQTWSPPKEIVDEDPDDPWEGLGPEPAEARRSVMKGLILVVLFGPAVFSLIGLLLAWLGRR